ncbi:YczE/YyaS/YitT family protein [Aquipuribacter sp. MA13-6]|uniref:membrane protein YczE n=1 Tax=unclassified Aquipuribacter TaxID=2635084 RepID=UPI003EEE38EB
MLPRPVPRRLAQLLVGLVLYGATMALMVRSGLGLNPWDVLHEGLSGLTGLTFGTVTVLVGAVVLLAWIALRQRPGIGTVANVVVIGVAVDVTLWLLPEPEHLAVRIAFLLSGIVGNGIAGGLYIGAGLGPGPRDGLMTGLVRVTGRSTRLVRTSIELSVLAVGWLIGGTVGLGTVLYALAIGPVVQLALGWFTVRAAADGEAPSARLAERRACLSPPTAP